MAHGLVPAIVLAFAVLFLVAGLKNSVSAALRLWGAWQTGQFDGPPVASRTERQNLYWQRIFWNVVVVALYGGMAIAGVQMLASYFLHPH